MWWYGVHDKCQVMTHLFMHAPSAIEGTVFYDSREWYVGYGICPCTRCIRHGMLWWRGVGMVWFDTCTTNPAWPDLAEHAMLLPMPLPMPLPCTWNVPGMYFLSCQVAHQRFPDEDLVAPNTQYRGSPARL